MGNFNFRTALKLGFMIVAFGVGLLCFALSMHYDNRGDQIADEILHAHRNNTGETEDNIKEYIQAKKTQQETAEKNSGEMLSLFKYVLMLFLGLAGSAAADLLGVQSPAPLPPGAPFPPPAALPPNPPGRTP